MTRHRERLAEANAFLRLFHEEQGMSQDFSLRLAEVRSDIIRTGAYWHTQAELAYGAKVAWRNNTHCVGKLYWNLLHVRDMRHLSTAQGIFEALVEHLGFAANGGKIRPTITVFAPQQPNRSGIRIWNPKLVSYAGYFQPSGSVVGDPKQVELTQVARRLGWKGGESTPFDILPLIIQMPGKAPELFELPRSAVLEVPISHASYSWFADLGLKWYAFPTIADMRLEIGGVTYPAAPFTGWYIVTEVGARNFGDTDRYNMLPEIGKRMGLHTNSDRTLWKDRALVELNEAVLYSFSVHGVTMIDHHAAARQFVQHEEKEQVAGRPVRADWRWIVPPVSGSTTPVFHRSYENVTINPNYYRQAPAWREASCRADSSMKGSQACPYLKGVK